METSVSYMMGDTNAVLICGHLYANMRPCIVMLRQNLFHVRTDYLNMSYNLATSLMFQKSVNMILLADHTY